MKSHLDTVISTFDQFKMSPYVAGPIYSSWMFRINATLINLTSRLVRRPDGSGVEHMPWEQDVSDDAKLEIANWLGVRNSIVDAIDSLEGGYPPASFEDTYNWLIKDNPEDNAIAIKQEFAREYIQRSASEKLHSTLPQYVEDNFATKVRAHAALVDNKDAIIKYLEQASYVKDRTSSLDYGNLPDWFEDMIHNTTERKFCEMYSKKLQSLDRKLAPTTRTAIETELFLMEEVAKALAIDLPKVDQVPQIDTEYLASLGIKLAA